MIRLKLLYARDFRALMLKYGRLDLAASFIGTDGQVVPGRRSRPSRRVVGQTWHDRTWQRPPPDLDP